MRGDAAASRRRAHERVWNSNGAVENLSIAGALTFRALASRQTFHRPEIRMPDLQDL